jgi:hypothetical protein
VGTRAFTDGKEGGFAQTGMTYSDFVFFMLAEEDKTSEASLRYWYRYIKPIYNIIYTLPPSHA